MDKKDKKNTEKKCEDAFTSFWENIDKASVKKFEHDFEEKVENSKFGRKFGYFVTALVNLGLLWLFKSFPDWTDILTNQYTQNVLWVFNILFVSTAIVNVIYLFLDKAWFRAPMQLIIAIITFFAWFNLYQIWPFNFYGSDIQNLDSIMRAIAIFILFIIAISAVSEFFSILFGFKHKGRK